MNASSARVETDPLYDCSAKAFAERFMRRAFDLHAAGRPMAETARLAFSFAARHLQELDRQALVALDGDIRQLLGGAYGEAIH